MLLHLLVNVKALNVLLLQHLPKNCPKVLELSLLNISDIGLLIDSKN